MTFWLLFFIAIALIFDFLNGFHDSANVVATAIASRALAPRVALAMAASADLIGPFLFGVAVATTIGSEVVSQEAMTIPVAMAALLSAIVWNLVTWLFGIPSSSSHALIGGFMGAAITGYGLGVIQMEGLTKVIFGLFFSPVIGVFVGWLIMRLALFVGRWLTPGVNNFFRRSQIFTMMSLGLSHGANDAQKTMGIITMGLVAFGVLDEFVVPTWVIGACAVAIALGTFFGGWRLIRTIGGGFYRIRAVHAFSSQVAGAGVILSSALLGAPVSTTQVISSSVVGAGAAQRVNMVRWSVAQQIVMAWVLTIPSTGLLGAVFFLILNQIV